MMKRKTIDTLLEYLLVGLMSVMVLNVLWQVFSRYCTGYSSQFTDELATFLLIWVGLLGTAYVAGKKGHLAIDLLPEKLKGRQRQRLELVLHVLAIVFALTVMVIGGIRLVYITLLLGQLSASMEVPLGYVYLSVPLSGLLIIYYGVEDIRILWQ